MFKNYIKRNFLLDTPPAKSISFTCCGTITAKIVHYFFSLRVTRLPVGEKTYSYRQGARLSKAEDKWEPKKQHGAKQQQKRAGEVNWDGKSWECQETDAVTDKRETWTALLCGLSNPQGSDTSGGEFDLGRSNTNKASAVTDEVNLTWQWLQSD